MRLKYIIICAIGLLFSSCADKLDLYSHSAMSPDAVTANDIPALRMGMYNNMQNDPGVHNFILFDLLGGDLQGGANNSPINLINSILSPLNSIVTRGWDGYYSSLYQVNNVLSVCLDQPQSEIRNLTLGEAYYFRALNYYNLVSRWGDVPLLDVNTLDKPFRAPKEEVWSFIESNLSEASKYLSASKNYYYVSLDAVTALQARVYLAQGKKTEAAAAANSLIYSGKYALDSFERIFRKLSNTEIIFAFENLSEESSINISDLFYSYAHPNKGQGNYRITDNVVNMYSSDDKRREMTIINIAGTNCVNKYPSGQTGRDPVIISRLSEMYLIAAESLGLQDGLSFLNTLRQQRGLPTVTPNSEADFLDAILHERRLEFLGENFRFYDLIRTGTAVSTLGILPYQTLLPIPGRELQRNTNLTPNQGY